MKTLGSYIKKLREDADWPQRKLAYKLNIDVSVLSKIENDNRFPKKRAEELLKIVSKLFNIPFEQLKTQYLSDEITTLLCKEKEFDSILKASKDKLMLLHT